MEKRHNSKHNRHVKITPDNSIDKAAIPVGVPCTYLPLEGIQGTEREGYFVMFVANKITDSSLHGKRKHVDIKPIRNSIGEYLVIVCRKK